jgi:hypothetical protein
MKFPTKPSGTDRSNGQTMYCGRTEGQKTRFAQKVLFCYALCVQKAKIPWPFGSRYFPSHI